MNKKGFTLIELLAVIVILAVIALIATPAVLNIIEDSKESAAKDSASVIAKAAETYYVSETTLQGEEVGNIDLTTDTLKYKGDKPEKGYVEFDDKGNAYLKMYMNGYCVVSDYDNTVTSTKMDIEECDIEVPSNVKIFTDGKEVYFNPLMNEACLSTKYTEANSADAFRGTEARGCLKWYAFKEVDGTYYMILDHNTSASASSWADAKTEIANVRDNNLYGWDENVRSTARFISATELHEIAPRIDGTAWEINNAQSWYVFSTGSRVEYDSEVENQYGWLYERLFGCKILNYGCAVDNSGGQYGYWTSDAIDSQYSWGINYAGIIYSVTATNTTYYGVRPVIEVSKTKFSN